MKKPLALITRPKKSAKSTANRLKQISIDSFIEPLIAIKSVDGADKTVRENAKEAQAIIITSDNAVWALDFIPKDFPIITVGKNTKAAANDAGFNSVVNADSNIVGLIEFIKNNYSPEKGKFIYASSDIIYGNLKDDLENFGFSIERIIVYKSIAAKAFTNECKKLLQNSTIDLMPFYSSRTAETFVKLLQKEKMEHVTAPIQAICLSSNISEKLDGIKFEKIHISDNLNGESLVELIHKCEFS